MYTELFNKCVKFIGFRLKIRTPERYYNTKIYPNLYNAID